MAVSVVAPQLLGGGTPATELAILVVALAVCAWSTIALHAMNSSLGRAPLALIGAGIATLWTLLQTLPLPCSWIAKLDPGRAHILRELAAMPSLEAPSCTLAWSPGSARTSLALAATLTTVLLTAVALARAGQRKLLMRGVAFSSVVMSVVALAHTVVRADRVFGIYLPEQARHSWLLAPLLNPNHLAGHLALGFPLCLALALSSKRVDVRAVWLGVSFMVLTTGLFTLSRGGAAALVFGGGGYLLVLFAQNRRRQASAAPRQWLGAAIAAAATFALASYFT
ncbi:MAG: hypothetical protein JWN04_5806, partial [Myxococcaceae bacterium]|nr:hypothetical protein [Myxococcaceae bacterium]